MYTNIQLRQQQLAVSQVSEVQRLTKQGTFRSR